VSKVTYANIPAAGAGSTIDITSLQRRDRKQNDSPG